ncbi:MAG: hypothetical protein Q7J25_08365 [Vicinamibacterales bacterium]|nr:hypothetical protein [Vicinamibacterales bacterium]
MRRIPVMLRPIGLAVSLAAGLAAVPAVSLAQDARKPTKIEIPASAIALEGIPKVRVEEGDSLATLRLLPPEEAEKERLVVRMRNGEFFWETRDNQPLRLNLSGEFTYLSTDPGHYIRLSRVGDTLTYVEHVEMDSRSVTWRGELRIVLGKKP